jgi:hypothetical protein
LASTSSPGSRAFANTTTVLQRPQSLVKELGVFLSQPPSLWCDNRKATYRIVNLMFHAQTKHIKIDFHFVRDKVASKTLLVQFISSKDKKADIFTELSSLPDFQYFEAIFAFSLSRFD